MLICKSWLYSLSWLVVHNCWSVGWCGFQIRLCKMVCGHNVDPHVLIIFITYFHNAYQFYIYFYKSWFCHMMYMFMVNSCSLRMYNAWPYFDTWYMSIMASIIFLFYSWYFLWCDHVIMMMDRVVMLLDHVIMLLDHVVMLLGSCDYDAGSCGYDAGSCT